MWLLFKMKLRKTSKLIEGTLEVRDGNNNVVHTFVATSGAPGWQYVSAQDKVGKGPLPACKLIGIQSYSVETKPLNHSATRGIRGAFFHVFPDPLKVNGKRRSEFGVHRDADAAGSAGCVALRDVAEWKVFQGFMRDYAKVYSHISMIVEYG